MIDQPEVAVVRWTPRAPSAQDELPGLLAAYHLQTQAEKGEAVAGVNELPDRYRAEIVDPRGAFGEHAVLLAVSRNTAVGCLVATTPAGGRFELKRLWTAPAFRGLGVASTLVDAALAHAAQQGADVVRLSVWNWRTGAIALYRRLGFTITESWKERPQLVCMQRAVCLC